MVTSATASSIAHVKGFISTPVPASRRVCASGCKFGAKIGLAVLVAGLRGAGAAGLADQRLAFAHHGKVAAGRADIGLATAGARAARLRGQRQEDQVVGRRATREALRDEVRDRLWARLV